MLRNTLHCVHIFIYVLSKTLHVVHIFGYVFRTTLTLRIDSFLTQYYRLIFATEAHCMVCQA